MPHWITEPATISVTVGRHRRRFHLREAPGYTALPLFMLCCAADFSTL